MLVTPDQIRAGRALINWSQADLAERSGLARPTIVNIENGAQLPEFKTLEKIVSAFDTVGIQFGINESVRRKEQDVKIYRGREEFQQFFTELYEHIKISGDQLFVSNVDDREWLKARGKKFEDDYFSKMRAIKDKIDYRALIKLGDNYMTASSFKTYRHVPEEDFATVPFHVYADRLSIFLFLDEPVIISIRDQEAADTYKEKFLVQWENAIPIEGQE